MPVSRITKMGKCITYWNEYFPYEMPRYWDECGQGHHNACMMDEYCVVCECTEEQAKELSAWFVNKVFAIPTCTHYDGQRLSLYCGDVGNNYKDVKERVESFIKGYFKRNGMKKKVMKVTFDEKCFCECCGDLEPFTAVLNDDSTSWCMDCAYANGNLESTEIKVYNKIAAEKKIEYFEKRVQDLKRGKR